jgi:signal peptidase II
MDVRDILFKKTLMLKIKLKKILLNSILVFIIFFADRFSKNYIIKIAELENAVDIYLNQYLNFYLIWNKGIAFGLFSFNEKYIYNVVTVIIITITIVVFVMLMRAEGFRKYSLLSVFAGSLGNIYDRIHYSAVPDFIDFHINNFHWFIFNVADIFITTGVICLIYAEILINKRSKINND